MRPRIAAPSAALLVVVAVAVAACGTDPAPPRLAPGAAVTFEQRIAMSGRTSGTEELPDVTVVQAVTVAAGEAAGQMRFAFGPTSVWTGNADGPPTLRVADGDELQRIYDAAETELPVLYAALFATSAGTELTALVDARGSLSDVRGTEEILRRRGGDAADDLPGAMFESALADPSLLLLGRKPDGTHPLRFTLAHWRGEIELPCDVAERADGTLSITHEDDVIGGTERGPFARLAVGAHGTARLARGDGLPTSVELRIDVSADVPTAGGDTRTDAATLTYRLTRTTR